MGYFDGLTNGNFKKDRNGNTVFFPWGVLGKGRVLADESTENKVRGFVRLYYQITLPMIIGVGIIAGWTWSFLLLPILGAWFHLKTKNLVAGCPLSEDRLTLKESYSNSAAGHNKLMLWLVFIFSTLFVVAGIWIAANATSSSQMFFGLASAIFFGTCGTAFGYMLKVKRGVDSHIKRPKIF